MSNKFLVSVAAVALIAGAGIASAQQGGGAGGAGGGMGGAAQSGSSGSGAAGGSSTMERSGPGTAAPSSRDGAGSTVQERGTEPRQRTGQTPQQDRQGNQAQDRQNDRSGADRRNQADQKPAASDTRRESTGAAPSNVKVTTEQRTQLRTKLSTNTAARVERSSINFNISVGTTVPRSVRFYDLPADIVTIVPAYRGYKYIVVEDEIVIIDPATYTIVTVIES